ncbi:MAG: F0F1 ATP synthase subunit gamma [Thiogranum sp.]|jgi:F-type H+-transporting ATPase subunit gamma
MTSRRQLDQHRHSLAEIRNIMNAMKNLAYMETRKLDRFLDAQYAVVRGIEAVAADFVTAFPDALPAAQAGNRVYLLVGSERGFCGDFNEALLHYLEREQEETAAPDAPVLIATGRKLQVLLADDPRVAAFSGGVSVVEEVAEVLSGVVATLAELQARFGSLALYALHHDHNAQAVVSQQLLPPFQAQLHAPSRFSHPPDLNLAPADFVIELSHHYLLAALQRIFYASLMAENQRRVQHLEAAVQHLDDQSVEVLRRCNALRQEEIIEEIEVILLNIAKAGVRKL